MNATRQTQQHTLICHDALIGASLFMMVMAHCVTNASPFRPLLFSVYVPLLYVLIGCRDRTRQNQTSRTFPAENLHIFLGGAGVVVLISIVDYCRLAEPSLQALTRALVDDTIRLFYLSGVNYGEHGSVGVVWFLGSIVIVRLGYRYVLQRLPRILTVLVSGIACLAGVFLTRRGIWLPLALDVSCVGLLFYTIGDLYALYRERITTIPAKVSAHALHIVRIVLVILCSGYWLWCLRRGVYIEMAPRSYQNMHSIVEAIAASYVVIIIGSAIIERIPWLLNILASAGRHPFLFIGVHGLNAYLAFLWNMVDPFSMAILECVIDTLLICVIQRVRQILTRTLAENDVDTIDAIGHWYAENVHRINALFYVAFTLVLVLEFQQSTMFTYRLINWTTYNRLYMVGMYALMVVVVLRFWNRWDRRQLAFRCLILGTGIMLWTLNGHRALLVLCMLIIAADGAEARRVLQIYIAVTVLGLAMAYLASMQGYIPWLTYDVHGHAMGSNYRTDHAAHWLYLFMAYRLLRGKRMTVIEYAIQACLIYYVYHLTTGKTFLPCAVLFLVLCMLTDYMPQTWRRGWMRQCASRIGLVMFVICTIFTYAVSLIGGYLLSDSDLLEGMSLYTIGSRIKLSYAAFLQYPIRLFSQYVYEQGAGGVINQMTAGSYFFLDSMYVRMLFIYGGVFLAIMLAIHTHMMHQSVSEHNTILWCALFVIAIDSIMEHHMTEFAFNILPVTMWVNSARRPLDAIAGEETCTHIMTATTPQRIEWIDIVKGILIVSIMVGHLGIRQINQIVFIYHVGGFFLLSGYTMKSRPIDNVSVEKKFNRLMGPYFITGICIILFDLVYPLLLPGGYSLADAERNLASDFIRIFWGSGTNTTFMSYDMGTMIGAIWFLPAMFMAVIIAQALRYYIHDNRLQLLAALVFYIIAIVSANYIWLPFSMQAGWMAVLFVVIGGLARERNILDCIKSRDLIIPILFVTLSYSMNKSFVNFVTGYARDYIIGPICAMVVMLAICKVCSKMHHSHLMSWMGRNSLLILCVHLFALNCLNRIVWDLNAQYANIKTFIVIDIIIPIAIVWLFDQGMRAIQSHKDVLSSTTIRSSRDCVKTTTAIIDVILYICAISIQHASTTDPTWSRILMGIVPGGIFLIAGELIAYHDIDDTDTIGLVKRVISSLGLPFIVGLLTIGGVEGHRKASLFYQQYYIVPVLFVGLLLTTGIHRLVPVTWKQWMVILMISLIGLLIGQKGYHAYEIDLILYSCIYMQIGYWLAEARMLEQHIAGWLYFVLSIAFASMLVLGGVNMRDRALEPYGTVVIGVVAGFMLLWMGVQRITSYVPSLLAQGIQILAENIILVYLLNGVVTNILECYGILRVGTFLAEIAISIIITRCCKMLAVRL